MTRTIDFYFDFPSPYAYLAHTQLPRIAAEHGATVTYHPFRILAHTDERDHPFQRIATRYSDRSRPVRRGC